MHQIRRPTLGIRWCFEEPGDAIVQSQISGEPPGVLKKRSELRCPKLHDRQAYQHAVYGQAEQEIGEGISRSRYRRELSLRVDCDLRRERRLKEQASQCCSVSIQMPSTPVA